MKKILVTRRSDDFHACLDGHPEIWGCGRSPYEAIGNLILVHSDMFKIVIVAEYK